MRQIKMLSFVPLLVGALTAASGCGSDSTADPAPGSGGSTTSVIGGGTTGGNTGGTGSSAADRFAGTWRYVSGTSTTVCGAASQTVVVSGTLQLGKGIDSDLVQVADACTTKFDVTGTTASVLDNQTCFVADGATSIDLRYRAWTFSTTDGHTMVENGSATLTLETATGRANCESTTSASLTKAAQ